MTVAEICSVLVKEPFNLSLNEVMDLVPWQVRRIYLHDVDSVRKRKQELQQLAQAMRR